MKDEDKKVLKELMESSQAFLPPRFFYNSLGGTLFEAITKLKEYTPTNDELSIFESNLLDIKNILPPRICLIDLGAGNCSKAEKVIPTLRPEIFLAVDLPSAFFRQSVATLTKSFENQKIFALEKDFTVGLLMSEITEIVGADISTCSTVIFFPGSTIGNYSPEEAKKFLLSIEHDFIILGVDLIKPEHEMINAYDDCLGITAAFNKNALLNANELLDTDFEVSNWEHRAIFNSLESRIEMHLVAKNTHEVKSPFGARLFNQGESIHTENSHKYSVETFKDLLLDSGYSDIVDFPHPSKRYAIFVARGNKLS